MLGMTWADFAPYAWSCMILPLLIVAVIAYFCGCFNGAVIVSKYILHDDVRTHGSGNAGLTNFYRVFGKQKILLVILADVLKTVIAVLAGAALFHWAGNDPIIGKLLSGLLCMVGHMFPFQFEFKGGKGVLAGGTMACFMGWKVAVAVWGIFFLMVILTRFVSLGSVGAGVLYPISVGLVYQNLWYTLLALVAGGLLVWRHKDNIKRLLRGEESKLKLHK